LNKDLLLQELQFKAVRSGGAGGQHVNKVSTKVELIFDLENSQALLPTEKERISQKLSSRLTKENVLLLQSDESRSQHTNKDLVIKKLFDLLEKALRVQKRRIKTKPSKSAIEKRLQSKKKAALKKLNRGKSHLD
jgi:ribosome-associated protein